MHSIQYRLCHGYFAKPGQFRRQRMRFFILEVSDIAHLSYSNTSAETNNFSGRFTSTLNLSPSARFPLTVSV